MLVAIEGHITLQLNTGLQKSMRGLCGAIKEIVCETARGSILKIKKIEAASPRKINVGYRISNPTKDLAELGEDCNELKVMLKKECAMLRIRDERIVKECHDGWL